jgi:hypothetical protein
MRRSSPQALAPDVRMLPTRVDRRFTVLLGLWQTPRR